MSRYIKLDGIKKLINACEWRMTLAKERGGNGFIEYDKLVLDSKEFQKRLSSLPTIEVSEDCISRADWLHEAIRCEVLCTNHMKSDVGCDGGCQYDADLLKRIDKVIDKVIVDAPSVVPSRETGKWVTKKGSYETICDNCEYEAFSKDGEYFKSDYCPTCGARMEG